jgi:hypothetical protein
MRVADWTVRVLVVLTFFGMLLVPEKWSLSLGLLCVVVLGTWSLLYPQGVLGWAKTAHPSIDVDDRSMWWVPRLIGCCFVILGLLIAFAFAWR